MTLYQFPIVGARFHPPANVILASVGIGVELSLQPEPGNYYDPNAIKVNIHAKDIPPTNWPDINSLGKSIGWNETRIKSEGLIHLGYLPKEIAASLRALWPNQSPQYNRTEIKGTLCFGANGGPKVRFEL